MSDEPVNSTLIPNELLMIRLPSGPPSLIVMFEPAVSNREFVSDGSLDARMYDAYASAPPDDPLVIADGLNGSTRPAVVEIAKNNGFEKLVVAVGAVVVNNPGVASLTK